MATITEIRDRFVNLKNSIGLFIVRTFHSTEIKAANRQRSQFAKGEMPDSTQIGEYSQGWAEVRERKGLQTEHVDLRFTGTFWNKIGFESITEDSAIISSSDWKTGKIEDKYGKVFGLNPDNTQKYARIDFFTSFINMIKKALWQR